MVTADERIAQITQIIPRSLTLKIEEKSPEGLTKTQLREIFERVLEEYEGA
jgi:hypothetical protein